MNNTHSCDKEGFRVAKYDATSGGGWFLDAEREKVNIIHCPYCGIKLGDRKQELEDTINKIFDEDHGSRFFTWNVDDETKRDFCIIDLDYIGSKEFRLLHEIKDCSITIYPDYDAGDDQPEPWIKLEITLLDPGEEDDD
jgi:hypothetical protein